MHRLALRFCGRTLQRFLIYRSDVRYLAYEMDELYMFGRG